MFTQALLLLVTRGLVSRPRCAASGPIATQAFLLLVIQGFQCECYLGAPLSSAKGFKVSVTWPLASVTGRPPCERY
jgi:hypothetical protein